MPCQDGAGVKATRGPTHCFTILSDIDSLFNKVTEHTFVDSTKLTFPDQEMRNEIRIPHPRALDETPSNDISRFSSTAFDNTESEGWMTAGWANFATLDRASDYIRDVQRNLASEAGSLLPRGQHGPGNWEQTLDTIELHKDKGESRFRMLSDQAEKVKELQNIVTELRNTATFCFQRAGFNPDVTLLDKSFVKCGSCSADASRIDLNLSRAIALVEKSAKVAEEQGRARRFNPEYIAATQFGLLSKLDGDFSNKLHDRYSDVLSTVNATELDPVAFRPPMTLWLMDSRQTLRSPTQQREKTISKSMADFLSGTRPTE